MWKMVESLARYERLGHEVTGSADRLGADLFSDRAPIECRVAERERALVGYALFFPIYSSFQCLPAMWLEDLYVEPSERGLGTGRRLLAEVARVALERKATRLGWIVLDWNRPSIDFYRRMGAQPTNDIWFHYGLDAGAMRRLTALDQP